MKKLRKILITTLLAASMTVSAAHALPAVTTPVIAQAAVKISAKKKTLNVGQSFTLKVSGTKKKVKWSSNKKSVATVSSTGKIFAESAGTAKITAKVGKKTYKCTVTVKNKAFNPDVYNSYELTPLIESRLTDSKYGVIAELRNKSDYTLTFDATVMFYKDNKMVGSDSFASLTLVKGMKTAVLFGSPNDYDDYNIVFNKSTQYYNSDMLNQVSISQSDVIVNDYGRITSVTAEIKNKSASDMKVTGFVMVVYDDLGNPVYGQVQKPQYIPAGGTTTVSFDNFSNVDNNIMAEQNFKFYVQFVDA
jgi:hypothetical protein